MLTLEGTTQRRERHVKYVDGKGRSPDHIYFSTRSDGTRVFEVRHPLDAAGRRKFETVSTRLDQAMARKHEIYADPGAVRVTSVGITLAEVATDWKSVRQVRPRSAESFDGVLDRHILPALGRQKVRAIGKLDIVRFLGHLKRQDGREGPLADGTKRMVLSVLDIVLGHAVEMGAISAVPKLDRKRKPKMGESRKRIVTPEEETALLFACARFKWLRPIITVSLHQALRQGEVAGLQWEDVDFHAGTLSVRHNLGRDGKLGPPKGGKACTIPLTPVAREVLIALWAECDGTGFVFRNTLGGCRQLRDIGRAFEKARDRAGLNTEHEDGPVVFHSLRHTGISRLANHPSIPLVAVRDFARHASLGTTQGYVHRIESETVTNAIGEALRGAA